MSNLPNTAADFLGRTPQMKRGDGRLAFIRIWRLTKTGDAIVSEISISGSRGMTIGTPGRRERAEPLPLGKLSTLRSGTHLHRLRVYARRKGSTLNTVVSDALRPWSTAPPSFGNLTAFSFSGSIRLPSSDPVGLPIDRLRRHVFASPLTAAGVVGNGIMVDASCAFRRRPLLGNLSAFYFYAPPSRSVGPTASAHHRGRCGGGRERAAIPWASPTGAGSRSASAAPSAGPARSQWSTSGSPPASRCSPG